MGICVRAHVYVCACLYMYTLYMCMYYCIIIIIIIVTGADIEKGASTPLMEASQEGHIDIVKYLLDRGVQLYTQHNIFLINASSYMNKKIYFLFLILYNR